MPLRTIGGGLVGADGKPVVGSKKQQPSANNSRNKSGLDDTCIDKTANGSNDDISFSDVKLGVNGPFTRTTVGRGRTENSDNASQEEILGDEYRRGQVQTGRLSDEERDTSSGGSAGGRAPPANAHGQNGIMVTETYRVERS